MGLFGFGKKKCPRCDSTNLNLVKPKNTLGDAVLHSLTMGIRKPSKPLNVCRACGFSWEDR